MDKEMNEDLKVKISSILQNDGVIAFVTDTVWGLGCLPNSSKAVEKIYQIKSREAQKPLILMSNSVENLAPYVAQIGPKAQNLIDNYFPGALTLVLKKSSLAPDYMTSGFDTVGIRVPANKVFAEICDFIPGNVLATTSANLSHEPSAKTYQQAVLNMGHKADLVIEDYGCCCQGLESTVALVEGDSIKVLRQGAVELNLK